MLRNYDWTTTCDSSYHGLQSNYNEGADCTRILIARCPGCSISLPPQPQQHFLEPSEVGGAGASPGNSFALRVLEFNDVTNSLPSGPLCERRLKAFDEIRLLLPIDISISSVIRSAGRQKRTYLFSRIDRSFLAAYSS